MLEIGDTVILRDYPATVAARSRDADETVWVTFGTAWVPSRVPARLLTPCPVCNTLAMNRHDTGCPCSPDLSTTDPKERTA